MQVVGVSSSHAFVWDSEHGMQGLASLSLYSGANGINASGQIIGFSGTSAVLWQPNPTSGGYVMTDLNSLIPSNSGWFLYQAYAINDMGQIVGSGVLKNNKFHAFLLTPTTTTALVQPTASTLTTTSNALPHSIGEMSVVLPDTVHASVSLTTGMQPSTPITEATGSTVPLGRLFAVTAPSLGTGSAVSSPSPPARTAPKQTTLNRDQIFAGFWDQFPDFVWGT